MNLLALVLTLAVAVSSTLLLVAPRRAADGDAGGPVHDISEAAFLNGGPARVVDTALTALHADGRLVVGGPGIVAVQRAEARDPVERAVLQELGTAANGALHTLREAVMRHPAVQETGDGLAARGLLVPPGENRSRRRWAAVQGVGCAVGLPVCVVLTFVQYAMHDGYGDMPVPFVIKVLPALLYGGVTGGLTAAAARTRITKAGRRAADAYRTTYAQVTLPSHLVATMGLGALPDPGLRAQLTAAARVRPAGQSSSAVPSYSSAASPVPTTWCAGVSPGGGSCGSSSGGGGGGSSCSSGTSCGGGSGGGSSCGSSGSSCGGGSSGGSSCGSSGSSCGSSS